MFPGTQQHPRCAIPLKVMTASQLGQLNQSTRAHVMGSGLLAAGLVDHRSAGFGVEQRAELAEHWQHERRPRWVERVGGKGIK